MTVPKRHHWWPQLQSSLWTASDGLITVTRSDGTSFRSTPINVGVEGELYTRFELTGAKDISIEKWFADEIETPFSEALEALIPIRDIKSTPFGWIETPAQKEKGKEVKSLGFVLPKQDEYIELLPKHRAALVNYLAAMLVRNPIYLRKLADFHQKNSDLREIDIPKEQFIKSLALDNMLNVYEIYQDAISKSEICLLIADCDHELLFADSGITASEPWLPGPIPFDIYAPISPKVAINVLPVPGAQTNFSRVMRVNNQGVARYNRIALGHAERFVFSRGSPPAKFIKANFGVPAPKSIGHRFIDGKLETTYDRSRDRSN